MFKQQHVPLKTADFGNEEIRNLQRLSIHPGSTYNGIRFIDLIKADQDLKIIKIPNTPHFIQGLIYYKEKIIPILDINSNINQSGPANDEPLFIILVRIKGIIIGVFINTADDLLNLVRSKIEFI